MTRTTGWVSIPKVLVSALDEQFPGAWVATRFPGPGDAQGPIQTLVSRGSGVIRVLRIGGHRDDVTDYASVAIDVIHASEGRAEDLAEEVAVWLQDNTSIRARAVPGVFLDRVTVDVAPHPAFYPDPTITQISATYTVTARRFD